MNERFAARLEQMLGGTLNEITPEYKRVLEPIAQLMRSYCQALEHMASAFIKDPDTYINPYLYLENDERWVSAPVSFEFIGGGLAASSEDTERIKIHKAQELRSNGTIVIRRLLLEEQSSGIEVFDTDNARERADEMTWMDFFFSMFRRGDADFDLVRQELRDRGRVALEIPV